MSEHNGRATGSLEKLAESARHMRATVGRIAILGILLCSLTSVAPSSAAAQYTVLCQNAGIGCISFSGYSGHSVWGYPVDANGNNCTNYAAFRLSQNGVSNPGNLGNAGEWASKAQSKGFTVNQTPAVGSIAQWNYGSAYAPSNGHVAYVEEVGSGYIVETESNYEGPSRKVRITSGDQYWPNNFIHFKDVSGGGGGEGPHRMPLGDWNGDGRSDYTVYYPATGEWQPYLNAANHGYEWATWGGPGWIPMPGDWNGDGKTDYTIYNPANGEWRPYINNPGGPHGYEWSRWGDPGWIPVPGDYNGDGRTDMTIYNPTNGEWRPYINNPGGEHGWSWVTWGSSGEIPVPGDYNGDGKTDYAVYNPYTGVWRPYINGSDHGYEWVTWGGPGWIPLPYDWNGDGRTDFVVYNPRTGELRPYINNPGGDHGYEWETWGEQGHTPVVGDWNGDGRADIATYSSATGLWQPFLTNPGGEHGWPWPTWGGGEAIPVVNYDNLLWRRQFLPPTATFAVTSNALAVSLDGTASRDAYASEPMSWGWSFGDGSTGAGAVAHHNYTASGEYTVTLSVRDMLGATASTSQTVTVANSTGGGSGSGGGGNTPGPVSSGAVTAGASSATVTTALISVLHFSSSSITIPALLKGSGFRFSFDAPEPGLLTIRWTTAGAQVSGHVGHKARAVVVASASKTFTAAGRGTVTMRLTTAGRKLLKTHTVLRVAEVAIFKPRGGTVQMKRGTITIRARRRGQR